jgi:hypothetical protein
MRRAALATSTMDWVMIERRALAVGGVGVLVCGATAMLSWPHFLRAYLVAWNFWAGVSLGALALLMIQYITGGAWGLLLRRFLEAAAGNILLLGLLFLVMLPGLAALYEWARPEAVAASAVLQHKSPYLNPHAFLIRAAIYFVSWVAIAWLLNSWSRRQDRGQRTIFLSERCRTISGPGLVVYGATVTLASIDWVMSLEPSWYSSMFPPLFAAGQILSGLAFSITALLVVTNCSPLEGTILPDQRRDMGNLLLAFVMIWAYLSFSQFMIIWSEDLPEEIPWYLNRIRGGWQWVALALVVLQFAVPFLLLLSREAKMNARSLVWIAALVLVMRFVDMVWWVEAAYAEPVSLYLLVDVAALLAIGGIWIWFFARRLRRSPLLPVADPFLTEYLPEAAT